MAAGLPGQAREWAVQQAEAKVREPSRRPRRSTPCSTSTRARGIKQLGEIFEHVASRLGANIKVSLELRADNPTGYDDGTRRIVKENAANLGARAAEFE